MVKLKNMIIELSNIASRDNNKELLSKIGELKGLLLAYEMVNSVELLEKMIELLSDLNMITIKYKHDNITRISNIQKASKNINNREGELSQFYIYLTKEGKKETTADAYRKTINQIIKELNDSKEITLNGLEDFEVNIDEILQFYIKKDLNGELKDNGRRISAIKQYQKFIIMNNVEERKMFNESQVELLERYEEYLREKGYAESSISIYSRRIKNFFKNGYSVDDLLGKLMDLIGMYSNGGSKFDPKDHANTSNALKRLAECLSR